MIRSGFRWTAAMVAAAAALAPAPAASYFLTPDVPTDLAGTTYTPWQVVHQDSGVYAIELALPTGTPVGALHQMCSGAWLFSVEAPTELPPGSGMVFDPRDVIRYDGTAYTLFFGGAAAGIPAGSRVDSLFLDGGDTADLVLGFDVPTALGAAVYEPADLVRFSSPTFTLYFDASTTTPPIPAGTDVTGAARFAPGVVLTFDVPTTLGASTFRPGELVSWNGTVFASYAADPGWPISSRLDGLSLPAAPGTVPPTVRVRRSSLVSGRLAISWSPSSSAGADDYGIYEGTLGLWYSHTAADCSDDGGDLQEEITPQSGGRYFLVVPLNASDEGSYGRNTSGSERPRGTSTCRGTQALGCP